MKLAHLSLPGLTSYKHAAQLQERLVRALLNWKHHSHPRPPLPIPTIITAEFRPVYTCGRRDIAALSESDKDYLRAEGADFHEALRGGQTTFHGPGQLVAYPIIDLKQHFPQPGNSNGLSAREYIHALEESAIRTCAAYGVWGYLTQHPGVWTVRRAALRARDAEMQARISLCRDQIVRTPLSQPPDVDLPEVELNSGSVALDNYHRELLKLRKYEVYLSDDEMAARLKDAHDRWHGLGGPDGITAATNDERILDDPTTAGIPHAGYPYFDKEGGRVLANEFRKICAVGVHMRRNVTSHGIGLNVSVAEYFFDRIVACGLEGVKATTLKDEGLRLEVGVEEVGRTFVRAFAEKLGGDCAVEIVQISEADVPD